jgi:hypothetical protein
LILQGSGFTGPYFPRFSDKPAWLDQIFTHQPQKTMKMGCENKALWIIFGQKNAVKKMGLFTAFP